MPWASPQPAAASIVEHKVPLVPDAAIEMQLNAPNHAEIDTSVTALSPELQWRPIEFEFSHLPDVFNVDVVSNERGAAVLANGKN